MGLGLGLGLGLGSHQLHGALEDVREGDVREVHVALVRYLRHAHAQPAERGDQARLRDANAYISPISRLYLAHISPRPRLHLG